MLGFIVILSSILFSDSAKVDTIGRHESKVFPIGYYTPETNVAGGLLWHNSFFIGGEDSVTKRSSLQTYLTLTLNKQFGIEQDWQLFSKRNAYFHTGSINVTRFPELFFGIGNSTKIDSMRYFSFDRISLSSQHLKSIAPTIYLGGILEAQYYRPSPSEGMNTLPNSLPGYDGHFIWGIGHSLVVDSRDKINATKGVYAYFNSVFNSKIMGSQYSYLNTRIIIRHYYSITKRLVMANELSFQASIGDIPFRAMPFLGGPHYLRGYFAGRFRDKHVLFYQSEFRYHLIGRFGLVAFYGLGQVFPDVSTFFKNSFNYSSGGGLRFNISKVEKTNIRFDVGITPEGQAFYLVFAETF